MSRRNDEAIFIINPSLRRSNSFPPPQLSCRSKKEREGEREREGEGESLKIDMRLQCSLDLQLDNLIQPDSSSSVKERNVNVNVFKHNSLHACRNDNVGSVDELQEKEDFSLYQRNHLGSAIVIIPGHLKNCIQKSRKKNCKKKARFLDYGDEEFSSEVGRYTKYTMGQI